jgi:diaminopimelate decarboxylase
MDHFQRKKGVLHAESIPLSRLAARHGTPLYVYSTATLTRHWRVSIARSRGCATSSATR